MSKTTSTPVKRGWTFTVQAGSLKGGRAHDRVCPFTGRVVTLEDVEKGMYSLPRINADSAYGYEVYPTDEWLMELFQKGMYSILTSEYRGDFLEFVHSMDAELQSFKQNLNIEELTNNPA